MAFEHREGSGSLFPNDRKTSDKQPDHKGQVMINGKLMDIAAWVKPGRNGDFLSIKISEPRQRQQPDANADEYQGEYGEPPNNPRAASTQQALRDSHPKPALPGFGNRPRR